MARGLLLSVRFHDGRYHGIGDWPPSPARLFQALVAGAACGHKLAELDKTALVWLESLPAPVIASPIVRAQRGFTNFVPNNDLDSVGGDPTRVGEIRAGKIIRPLLFGSEAPLLYAWTFVPDAEAEAHARSICIIAERLFQLGRGVDMAWASGEILEPAEIETRLAAADGVIHRPGGTIGRSLLCPMQGSFESLAARFHGTRSRFSRAGKQQLFTQPRKARFAMVIYDSPPQLELLDLRQPAPDAPFSPWALTKAIGLVERARDGAAARLREALPGKAGEIDRVFIGRESTEADKAARIRIIPLPSIGHRHADHAIRRVAIEIPPNCPLRTEDISWSFSGLDLETDHQTGEVLRILTPATDHSMLRYFGFDDDCRAWRSATPVALPVSRRRIDPAHICDRAEQKDATERLDEEAKARSAVRQALRHAGIDAPVESIRVQREPWEAKGARAEDFATPPRFPKERLWHVQIAFTKAVRGPLVLGDGRYLGLGLLAPVRKTRAIFAFVLKGAEALPGHEAPIASAARRAVMSRVQEKLGQGKLLPAFFTGHEPNGAPHRPGHHAHLFYAVDLSSTPAHLLIIAPHLVEHRRATKWEHECCDTLEDALADFTFLRAGAAGLFDLSPLGEVSGSDPICGLARTWVSATPYRPTRHRKRSCSLVEALVADVACECARRNLPHPAVEVISIEKGPRGGIEARLCLTFSVAVEGPILLGHDAHEGGGAFKAVQHNT